MTACRGPITTVCPFCDQPPQMKVGPTQWICGTEDCPAFIWNPLLTKAENRRRAAVVDGDLTQGDPTDG